MSTDSVAIVGLGITTPVGLSAKETAASVRSGTMRFVQSNYRDQRFEQFTLGEVPGNVMSHLSKDVASMSGLSAREIRMLRFASSALRECVGAYKSSGSAELLALCLAMPEWEATRPLNRPSFVRLLSEQVDKVFDASRCDTTHNGRAGGLTAVGQGVATIRNGVSDFILVGGVDSFIDLYVLGLLDMQRRIKSAVNLDGFIPGEGAAFLLLANPQAAAARGLPVLGRLSGVAIGFERGHLYSPEPYRGDGLAETLAQLPSLGAISPVEEVFSSMNGESHWSKEWGVSYMRNRRLIQQGFRMHHPADACGDTGAACGPLMIGLAALGIRDNYRNSPALVYGSSDHGSRAAVVVSAH